MPPLEPHSIPMPGDDGPADNERVVMFEAAGNRITVSPREALAIMNIISAQLMMMEVPADGGRRFAGFDGGGEESEDDLPSP